MSVDPKSVPVTHAWHCVVTWRLNAYANAIPHKIT